mmetsp:Transcript_41149/g.87649  ORF Transcript_41149/g.87649 Transcript_41149/m.87649 type:complete len:287 (-) Transcript_41149:627-1487(-)
MPLRGFHDVGGPSLSSRRALVLPLFASTVAAAPSPLAPTSPGALGEHPGARNSRTLMPWGRQPEARGPSLFGGCQSVPRLATVGVALAPLACSCGGGEGELAQAPPPARAVEARLLLQPRLLLPPPLSSAACARAWSEARLAARPETSEGKPKPPRRAVEARLLLLPPAAFRRLASWAAPAEGTRDKRATAARCCETWCARSSAWQPHSSHSISVWVPACAVFGRGGEWLFWTMNSLVLTSRSTGTRFSTTTSLTSSTGRSTTFSTTLSTTFSRSTKRSTTMSAHT